MSRSPATGWSACATTREEAAQRPDLDRVGREEAHQCPLLDSCSILTIRPARPRPAPAPSPTQSVLFGRGRHRSAGPSAAAIDEFTFGYCLTVHKAQGSQWDNVYLFDESYVFREDRQRWLYTGVTRASEKITVVM
jgi:hypothetical protein